MEKYLKKEKENMAELNFKYGQYSSLLNADGSNKLPLSEGTIYVTTDERAMFVDLRKTEEGEVERVRIEGSVQYYKSIESFSATTNPPYSQDTLYFFRNINDKDENPVNALMAYDGTNWVQVNVTLDAFNKLSGSVNNLTTTVTGLSDRLNALLTTDEEGNESGRIVNIETRLSAIDGEGEGSIKALEGRVGDLEADNVLIKAGIETNKTNIANLTTKVTTAEGNITTLQETVAGHGTSIDGLQDEIDAAKRRLDALDTAETGKIAVIEKSIEDIEGVNNTQHTDIEGLKTSVANINSAIGTLATKEQLESTAETLQENIDNNTEEIGKNATAIKNLQDLVGGGEGAGDLVGRVATVEGKVTTLEGQVTGLNDTKADKTALAKLKTELEGTIESEINAANAMNFIKTIVSTDELPTSGVSIGDTYVMSETGVYGGTDTTVEYSAGDFFIASGTEENGVITGDITWNHVKSGYDSAFDPSLKTTSTEDSATVALHSFTNKTLGAVTIASDSENIKVTTTGDADTNKRVAISLVWGKF